MKNFSKVLGIIAVAIIGFSMVSCSMFGSSGGGFGAPGAPKVSKAPALPDGATFPATENAAYNLIRAVDRDVISKLRSAFSAAALGDNADYDITIKEYTYDFRITDSKGKFKEMLKKADGSEVAATITKASTKESKTLIGTTSGYDYFNGSIARKAIFTFGLTDAFNSDYLVGGIVTVNYSDSYRNTLTEANDGSKTADKFTNKSKEVEKISFALTVVRKSDQKGAKFRWSSAEQSQGTQKKVTDKGQSVTSDLEIYDGNTKQHTVQDYDAGSFWM